MSVNSVRAEMTRVVREAFENNNGEIDADGMKAVIDEAKKFRLGSREVEAVLQPGAYLDGFALDGIRFTPEAYKLAESLATDHGVDLFQSCQTLNQPPPHQHQMHPAKLRCAITSMRRWPRARILERLRTGRLILPVRT